MIDERLLQRDQEYVHAAAGTPAGDYLRRFWQPVYHTADLIAGRPVPLTVMNAQFTLYRGETGEVMLIDARCPHRGALLSVGRVEGNAIRCFYHGWKFGANGACVEQPAEESSFARKVAVRSYPTREYLGLIFAYLGDSEPPEFPQFPEFEHFGGFVEVDSYLRECNYFQNLENALDMSHVAFVHHDNSASFAGIGDGLRLEATESAWGVRYCYERPDGQRREQQFGMPNIFHMTALPTDPEIGWQESLFWWVPINDTRHMQFSLHRVPATGASATAIHERRQRRRAQIDLRHQDVCEEILSGRLALSEVDPNRVDLVRLQDDIAQNAQGEIANRQSERLGRGDVGVIAIRKIWNRELNAMRNGEPLKQWLRTPDTLPIAWALDGAPAIGTAVANNDGGATEIVDIRPYVEIEAQLAALRHR